MNYSCMIFSYVIDAIVITRRHIVRTNNDWVNMLKSENSRSYIMLLPDRAIRLMYTYTHNSLQANARSGIARKNFPGKRKKGVSSGVHAQKVEVRGEAAKKSTTFRKKYYWNLCKITSLCTVGYWISHPATGDRSFSTVCETTCHRTYDKTWTSRVSSIRWKHCCFGVSQPRCIVTVCYFTL